MKNFLSILLITCIALSFVSCTENDTPLQVSMETAVPVQTQTVPAVASPTETVTEAPETPKPPFEGKIAIISLAADVRMYAVPPVIDKYGEDKVVYVTWPVKHSVSPEEMIDIVTELGADPDIKAIVVEPYVHGTNAAFEKLRETRKDIFVIYCEGRNEYANIDEITQTADMVLVTDLLSTGSAMVRQAQKMGAKTFVHYSYPRQMSYPIDSERRDRIKKECENLGIKFVDVTALDPYGVDGIAGAQQWILDNVPKIVAKYGKDTAFFVTHCALNIPLISAVAESRAIYPQPCCMTQKNVFLHTIGTSLSKWDNSTSSWVGIVTVDDYIAVTRDALAKRNMLGRASIWPVDDYYMYTFVGAEYAVKWINGEVPKNGVDVDVLKQLMEDYAGVEVFLTPYVDEYPYTDEGTGETYDNFLMMRMDYLTFE